MSVLERLSTGWSTSTPISQTSQDASYTFNTNGKYLDKDIKFNINVPGIVLKKPTVSGTYTTFTVQVEDDDTIYTWKVDSDGNIWIE